MDPARQEAKLREEKTRWLDKYEKNPNRLPWIGYTGEKRRKPLGSSGKK